MKKIMMTLVCLSMTGIGPAYAQEQLKLNNNQMERLGINTAKPTPVEATWSRNLPARIVIPNAQIRVLSPMMAGLVNRLYSAEGDRVKKGQKLAEVSSPAYLAAQQDFLDGLSEKALMEKNHLRNIELLKEGIISEKRFQTSQSALRAAEATLSRSRQALIFAGMSEAEIKALATSRIMHKSMLIRAPFAGTILKQITMTGEHVDATDGLYHLGQLDPLWVEIHMPFAMIPTIEAGNKVRIAGMDVQSEVTTIGRMLHEEDQGILVRAILKKGADQFVPGQFVEVSIEQKISGGRFYRVPAGAIIRQGADIILFVRNPGGFALKKARLVAEEGGSLVLDVDLGPQDLVAIKGIATLKAMLEGLGSEE